MNYHQLFEKEYIPLDKSWMIRLGVLDLLNGYDNMINFLSNQKELGEDLEALLRSSIAWNENKPIDVGESATIYRCLRFASWKRNEDREFIKRGTLKYRNLGEDPDMIHWPLEKLLARKTSQWATAALLCGNSEIILKVPPKVRFTYEAKDHWDDRHEQKRCWQEGYDLTLSGQASTYLKTLAGDIAEFVPIDAEDYCFARAFNYMSLEEGIMRWPQLADHESNRFFTMEQALGSAWKGETIVSDDHRVVQAMAMWGKTKHIEFKFSNPNAVKKSWPQFWRFLEASTKV